MSRPNSDAPQMPYKIVRHSKDQTSISEQEIEASVRSEGYEGFLWNDPPGSKYPRHRHGVDELIWLVQGEIWFKFGNEIISLSAGDRLYLPRHLPHEVEVSQSKGAKYYVGQKKARIFSE